jgi:hypothetical protein
MVGGLLIFMPLYGAPALLVRELARRRGTGWRGILALAGAAGLLQAGVIDQSLFSASYRGLDTWAAWQAATLIPGLGVSLHMAIAFRRRSRRLYVRRTDCPRRGARPAAAHRAVGRLARRARGAGAPRHAATLSAALARPLVATTCSPRSVSEYADVHVIGRGQLRAGRRLLAKPFTGAELAYRVQELLAAARPGPSRHPY